MFKDWIVDGEGMSSRIRFKFILVQHQKFDQVLCLSSRSLSPCVKPVTNPRNWEPTSFIHLDNKRLFVKFLLPDFNNRSQEFGFEKHGGYFPPQTKTLLAKKYFGPFRTRGHSQRIFLWEGAPCTCSDQNQNLLVSCWLATRLSLWGLSIPKQESTPFVHLCTVGRL